MDNTNLRTSTEGGLEKPTRHVIDWKNPDFLNEEKYEEELKGLLMHVTDAEDASAYVIHSQHYLTL